MACVILIWAATTPASQPAEPVADSDSIFDILEEQAKIDKITDLSGRTVALREAPGSHWLIAQSVLQTAPGLDLYDILRTLPGMIPRQLSLSQSEANMRADTGTPDLESLVVVDGRSVSSDGAGAFYDRSLLNLRDIERVEVVNGPSSTLYGPNALLGVISVTRKKPRADAEDLTFALDGGLATGSPTNRSSLSTGAFGRLYASYEHGWGSGGLRLSSAAELLPSFGYQDDSGHVSQNLGKRVTGTADVIQSVGRWQLRAQADAALKSSNYEIADGGKAAQQDYALNLLAEHEKLLGSDDRLVLNAWLRRYIITLSPDAAFSSNGVYRNAITSLELRSVYALPTFRGNSLTVGAQMRLSFNEASYELMAPANQFLTGLFAEDTYRPIRQLVLTAGIRFDNTATFGEAPLRDFHISPRVAATWLMSDKHSLRAEYASAFRNPVILQSAAVLRAPSGELFVVGNPNLKDESIDAFLLGYMGEVGWLSMRFEAYLSHTKNNIAPTLEPYTSGNFTGPAGQPEYRPTFGGRWKYPFYFYNLSEFWIPGALARLDLKPLLDLHFFINYTYQPIETQHFAGVGGDYRYRRFVFAAQAFFNDQPTQDTSGDRDLSGRVFVNARVSYALDRAARYSLALTVMNGLNVHFFEHRRPGFVTAYGDSVTGEQLGPRAWLTFELRPFANAR